MNEYVCGTGVLPLTDKCLCVEECEFPCWQRFGWGPPCPDCNCPDFPKNYEEDEHS